MSISKAMKWTGHVKCMRENESGYRNFFFRKPEENKPLGNRR
jgi:hypothetical protein